MSFEVVAGHRRLEAAKRLGLRIVPCFVQDLTDDQAREIGLVDNLQREDVPALEEADAYEDLRQVLGTPAAIAARVGKDVAYVAKRLQLVALGALPRRALAERLITIDHALLIARLGEDEQDETLKWTLDRNAGSKTEAADVIVERLKWRRGREENPDDYRGGYLWEPESVARLKAHIEGGAGSTLDRAPWPLDEDYLVPDAGSCLECPKNTALPDLLYQRDC